MIVSDAMSDHQVMVLASSIEGIVDFLGSVHTTRKRLIGAQRQLRAEGNDYRALVNAKSETRARRPSFNWYTTIRLRATLRRLD
jgi:hypothetical protein